MSEHLNALQSASSAYLRSAQHQPVEWNQWSPEAFAKAKQQDKPILLDIGAVWCHWCHVMDRESYENAEIAAVINEHFIAVKVDRDERPDVDSRYQVAVQAISGQGGWPLTAFLTPDGRPFFGGTYFPPEDRYGRVGFKRVLLTLAQSYRERRADIEESAEGVMAAIAGNESFAGMSGDLRPATIDNIVQSALKQFDPVHGGFGTQPKFPHPSALDLLLDHYARSKDDEVRRVCETTLVCMAQGGIYDQLAGGFHRYSVDDKWIVPHFEKMSYDNSELLKNYAHAYQIFGDEFYASVARDIIRWMDEWLSDRDRGGFYASQDADYSLEDDGDYFTWTRAELDACVSKDDAELAAAYYDVGVVGEMHHDPTKNVLFIDATIDQLATRFTSTPKQVRERISRIKREMLDARLKRPTPFVDKTCYTNWNAMCISAYLHAARALDDEGSRSFALKSLDRLLASALHGDQLSHVIADNQTTYIEGVLDDYAFTIVACLDAFESTTNAKYLAHADIIASSMISHFADDRSGGFFDIAHSAADRTGALAADRKPLQDSPTPAGNPAAAIALSRLAHWNDDLKYRDIAESTLKCFAGVAPQFGYFAATYGIALRHVLDGESSVVIMGDDDRAHSLRQNAGRSWRLNRNVLHIARHDNTLPGWLRDQVTAMRARDGLSTAIVCEHNTCSAPVGSVEELTTALAG